MNRLLPPVVCTILLAMFLAATHAAEPRAMPKRAWGPEQATGEPDTPVAGDQTTAWASATPDGADEWLELEYAEAVLAESVLVYETYNPGALFKVVGYTDTGMDAELWTGKDPTPPGSGKGVSEIALKGKLETKRIRLHLKSTEVPGWNEIDAVGLKDAKGKIHWAVSAKASTTFAAPVAMFGPAPAFAPFGGFIPAPKAMPAPKAVPGPVGAPVAVVVRKPAWGVEQVTGEPDTKAAGDQITAWASATPDGAEEWLEVEFAAATKIESVQIHETYNPGAVHKVTGYDEKGKEVDLWEGKDPTDPKEAMGVSEIPLKGKLKTNRLRIYLKSTEVPGWNEIDAIGIKDAEGKQQWATKATASSVYGAGFFGGFGLDDFEVFEGPIIFPALPAPAPAAAPAVPAVPRPDPRDARIDKLEKELAELKKSLAEIRKLLEKGK